MPTDDVLPSGALLIGDTWLADTSGGRYEHVFAGTGEVNATVALAGAAEIDRAVIAAARAQRQWAAMSVDTRRDLLLALADAVDAAADEFIWLNVHDYAAPLAMSTVHPGKLTKFLRYYAGWVDKGHGSVSPVTQPADFNLIEREPYGVVGLIIPWNGPLFGIGMTVPPALAAGNAVVLKPPELAPLCALRFGELCLQVGLPPGLVNVVPGGPEAGEALVRHPGIAKIHFIGSGVTAKKILAAAAENLTPVGTELGGKSASIVFADADLDSAAQLTAFMGPILQSGQNCACGSRIMIEGSIYDEFVPRLVERIESFPVGDPFDEATMVGPVVSQQSCDRIMGVVESAVQQQMGTLLTGGHRLDGELAGGFFIAPTVFGDVDNRTPLATFETFGPVVSVMRFDSEEAAVEMANATTFGLGGYLHTSDLKRAHRVARRLQAGTIWVNAPGDIAPGAPYGGFKQSGTGRLGSVEGLYEFTQLKTVRFGMS